MKILASAPIAAQGLDCDVDAGECGFTSTGPIVLRFDRWLLPTTATRGSISLITAGTGLGVTLEPDYDVATRTIRYNFGSIPEGVVYTLVLPGADQDPSGRGFRAFDGQPLDSRLAFSFRTASKLPPANVAQARSAAPTCEQVVATLASAGCSRLGCHSRQSSPRCTNPVAAMAWDENVGQCVNVPRMGLLLDDAQGLLTTAINQVAHETQDGTDITRRYESSGRFGDQMPLVDPGHPENSYLIYKILIGKAFNRELELRTEPSDPLSPVAMAPAQIDQARDWFIRFGPMPPDEVGAPNGISLYDTYQVLSQWTQAGAACP